MGGARVFLVVVLLALWASDAAHGQAQAQSVHHRFRFFIHPDLVQGIGPDELKSRLRLYVQDLNIIFSRNTIRRFDFDPDADLSVTDSPPPIGYYPGTLPETNYEVWAMVEAAANTPYPFTHGGYMSLSTNGAGVAAGLYWDAVQDRNALLSAPPDDWNLWNYWRQLDTLAHELGHVFGAGSGEYYSLRNVPDTTGVSPQQGISYTDDGPTADPYWSQHPDYWHDPMMVWTPRLGWSELIHGMRFADVTAALINAGFRNVFPLSRHVPDLATTRIWVLTGDRQTPTPGIPVTIWKVQASPPFTAEPLFQGATGSGGYVQLAWNAQPNNFDNLILIKAWPGALPPVVKWFSLYDAQERKMVYGHTNLNIYLRSPAPAEGPALTIRTAPNAVAVGWPGDVVGYALQTATDLSTPDWQPARPSPMPHGTQQEVTFTPDPPLRVFRLRLLY